MLDHDAASASGLCNQVAQSPRLRERYFGELDGDSLETYAQVWPRDLVSANHGYRETETVDEVVNRVRLLILQVRSYMNLPFPSKK